MSTEKTTDFGFTSRLLSLVDEQTTGNAALFAQKVGVTQATFHNYTKGRLPNVAILNNICSTFKVNLNWLVTGEGPRYIDSGVGDGGQAGGEPHSPIQEEPVNIQELQEMTTAVLESSTIYRAALAANIRAFYRSVKNEEEKLEMNEHLKRIEAKHDADMLELKEMIQALSPQTVKKSLAA